MDFPDDSSSGGDTDGDDSDDGEDRGMFHHEVEHEPDSVVDVFSGDAHPIAIKGDACVAEILKCQDLSNWRNQFPIYKYQWAIGAEIGNQISFSPARDAETASFTIPGETVGFYIQVTATRRVENQFKGTYQEDVEGGVYDPHIQKARHADLGGAPTYTDVASTAIAGPVLLSDVWSYAVLRALSDGEFQCAVKLRDEIMENETDGLRVEGELVNKVVAAMSVDLSTLQFCYAMPKSNKGETERSTLFSFNWLKKLFGNGDPEELLAKSKSFNGEVTAMMKLKTISVRLASGKRTIILATAPRKKGFSHIKVVQDLIRFDVDPKVGRDVLFYICLGFQAAAKFKLKDPQYWTDAFARGEVEQGKELIQRYIEYMTQIINTETIAFEEQPQNPWDY